MGHYSDIEDRLDDRETERQRQAVKQYQPELRVRLKAASRALIDLRHSIRDVDYLSVKRVLPELLSLVEKDFDHIEQMIELTELRLLKVTSE